MTSWFLTTRLGRYIAAGGAIATAIGLALFRAFMAGRKAEREKQIRASLENLRNRTRKNEEIGNLSEPDVDRRLDRWVSDDER